MNYEPVIGIEVHVELNTKSKMFCRCSADYFGKPPNTHTCPICLGLPGSLPYINEQAIRKCIQIGVALNCKVADTSLFERKNYFYPDLPKSYQISQYRWPLCVNGWIEIEGSGGKRKIRINRVHQEEDTGKLTHTGSETLIDFNRSGVPLVEIVTEPDFTSSAEVKDYAKKLQQIFRYLGVSNADMERGDMRLEANISVRPIDVASQARPGSVALPNYRVELKNINSFRFMVAAIEYEIKRQIELLEKGETLTQETRGWNEDKKCTYLQRSKEEAHDYRYFPEPDLPEFRIQSSEFRIEDIKRKMPELPDQKIKRYTEIDGLSKSDASIIAGNIYYSRLFEAEKRYAAQHGVTAKEVANIIINKAKSDTDSYMEEIPDLKIVETIVKQRISIISDKQKLEELAKQAIKENPKAVLDFKAGKENAIQVLIGAIMKLSSGKAEVSKVKDILKKLLI